MPTFTYHCPFCDRPATITEQSKTEGSFRFHNGNKYGTQIVTIEAITCPNPDCREYSLTLGLYDTELGRNGNQIPTHDPKQTWPLIPSATYKKFPDYIPKVLLEDYQEACEIRELSPKASATLSRRCLQGMLRDYWKVKPGRLYDEIEAIKDSTSEDEWNAITAVKDLGNIGAHMKRDINEIVEVDPDEAQMLTDLIEVLFQDWYVARHERQERFRKVSEAAASKKVKPEVSKPE